MCGNTAAMLGEEGVSWLSGHFVVLGAYLVHCPPREEEVLGQWQSTPAPDWCASASCCWVEMRSRGTFLRVTSCPCTALPALKMSCYKSNTRPVSCDQPFTALRAAQVTAECTSAASRPKTRGARRAPAAWGWPRLSAEGVRRQPGRKSSP